MADDPREPGGRSETPDQPPETPGRPPETPDEPPAWRTFVLGAHGSPRRTSALRGLAAAIVVLVVGLPLAIALPGSGSPGAETSSPSVPNHAGNHHCPRTSVAGGEKPPAVQPAAAAPGNTVYVFGPTPHKRGGRPPGSSHVEVWLNTSEPDTRGTPLGAGPVQMLASEKIGHDCALATSFSVPRLPSGAYEVRTFAFTGNSKQGWQELGGRTLTITRHPGTADKTGATTFAADFLLARLDRAGGAVKAMMSKTARFPSGGERGALFAKSYRAAKVTSIHSSSKGTYRVGVRITTADGPPVVQTLEVGSGTSLRGDDLALVVTRASTASLPVASST